MMMMMRALLCASVYLFVSSRQNMMKCVFFCDVFSQQKRVFKSSRWTTLEGKFDLIRVFDEYNVCVYVNVGL